MLPSTETNTEAPVRRDHFNVLKIELAAMKDGFLEIELGSQKSPTMDLVMTGPDSLSPAPWIVFIGSVPTIGADLAPFLAFALCRELGDRNPFWGSFIKPWLADHEQALNDHSRTRRTKALSNHKKW